MARQTEVIDYGSYIPFENGLGVLEDHSSALEQLFSEINDIQTDIVELGENVKTVDPGTGQDDFLTEAWTNVAGLPSADLMPILYVKQGTNLWLAPNDPDNFDIGPGSQSPETGSDWINLTPSSAPNADWYVETTTDKTTTSTSFVAVDGTNFSFTLTTTGRPLLVSFHGTISNNAAGGSPRIVKIDVTIDGTRIGGTNGLFHVPEAHSDDQHWVPINIFVYDLPADEYIFQLVWSTSGNTATMNYVNLPRFDVREL